MKSLDDGYERYPGMRAAIEEIQREEKRMSDGDLKLLGVIFYKHFNKMKSYDQGRSNQ